MMKRSLVLLCACLLACGAPAGSNDASPDEHTVDAVSEAITPIDVSPPDSSVETDVVSSPDIPALDASMDVVLVDSVTSDRVVAEVTMMDVRSDGPAAMFTLPPENAPLDYQLGGAYTPPMGVRIVSRDRTDPIAPGLYNICYVNGFQVQPGEQTQWQTTNPDLLLRDSSGMLVIDTDWNEPLLDVSTAAKRMRIAAIVDGWIAGCRSAGYQAVEIDNLDSFTRSRGLLQENHAVAMMALFSASAHARGMAIAQKNSAELVPRRREMQTDFVVAEECNRYSECGTYTAAYGNHVLVIEYRRADFTAGCTAFPNLSIVLRDRNLVPAGRTGYVFDGC